jgi:hypothetical protein
VGLAAGCGSGYNASGRGGIGGPGGAAWMGGASGTGSPGGTSGAGGAGSPVVYPPCSSGEPWTVVDGICAPSGFPFVQYAFAQSNQCPVIKVCPTSPVGTTIRLSQPAAGTLCVSGTNPNSGNITGILVGFTVFSTEGVSPTYQKVLEMFNADLLGITQVRFTIDRPPSAGVSVWANALHSNVCNAACFSVAFALASPITATGTTTITTTASFTDFTANPVQTFDTRALASIGFDVGPGDFDFCVRDFQFLDAQGVEVKPKSVTQVDASADGG